MKRTILFLVIFGLVAAGVFGQTAITGKVDVEADIDNAFKSGTNVTYTTASGDTEVDISAIVDDFSSITIQFRGIELGNAGEGGINAGDIFVDSDILGAFGWSELVPDLVVRIKGGLFNPEPNEKGEVFEVANIVDIIGQDEIASGAAALVTVGYTDWFSFIGGVRFDLGGEDVSWVTGVSGEGGFSDDLTIGKLGYTAYATNNNGGTVVVVEDDPATLDKDESEDSVDGSFNIGDINVSRGAIEVGVGLQYSGLQLFGTIRSAGGTIAEPGDVPILELGLGAQVILFPEGHGADNAIPVQWGANLAFKILTFIDLGFEIGGTQENPLNAAGVELKVVNPGENVGRIFGLGVEFLADDIGAAGTNDAKYTVSPELTLQAGSTGPQFRFAVPFNVSAFSDTKIELDVEFGF